MGLAVARSQSEETHTTGTHVLPAVVILDWSSVRPTPMFPVTQGGKLVALEAIYVPVQVSWLHDVRNDEDEQTRNLAALHYPTSKITHLVCSGAVAAHHLYTHGP